MNALIESVHHVTINRTHTHPKNCITVTKEYNIYKLNITLLHTIIMPFFLSTIVYSTSIVGSIIEITADQS